MILKTIYIILLFIYVITGSLYSQDKKINYTVSHPIKFGKENLASKPSEYIRGSDSFKVVAIMVQFIPDTDGRTSGNGLFDMSNRYFNPSTGRDTVVDSPPYDSAYFDDHLKLQNFY